MGIAPITFHLDYQPPFDWEFFLHYLSCRQTTGVETIEDKRYTRAIEVGSDTGTISLSHLPSQHQLMLTIRGEVGRHAESIRRCMRRMFDLDLDPPTVARTLGHDPSLAPLIAARPGIRVPGAWSAFELLIRTIVGQQVSVRAATTIMGRITTRLGRVVPGPDGASPILLFPTPAMVADSSLESIGMQSQRTRAVQAVARAIASKSIPFPDLDFHPDGVREALLALSGVGPWTVEYFAMRGLRDADAWPGTDLVLRRSLEKHAELRTEAASAILEKWQPHRAYAAMYLWSQAATVLKDDSRR